MKVAVVTSAHRWDDPRVFDREARSIAAAGHDVHLIAPGAPTGVESGVAVRGPELSGNRLQRMTVSLRRLVRAAPRDADVVHIHDPELLIWFALLLLRRRRPALVYDAHEDYAAQLREKPWIPAAVRRPLASVLGACEHAVARRCDLVVAATPAIGRRFSLPHVVIVENHPRTEELPSLERIGTSADRRGGDRGGFEFVHVGELNPRRGARELMAALDLFPDSSDLSVTQIGPVKPGDLLDNGSTRLGQRGTVAHADALDALIEADAGLVLFHSGPNHDEAQPNKLFEYLACGLPVVASDFALWRRLAEACEALVVFVDPCDPTSIADGMQQLRDAAPHDRVRQARLARQAFDWERQAEALVRAYAGLPT